MSKSLTQNARAAAVDKELKDAATELVNSLGLELEGTVSTPREASNWIEVIDKNEIDTTSGEIIWTTIKDRFISESPKEDDILYLFVMPKQLCVGSYKIEEVIVPNSSEIVFKLVEDTSFDNPLSLNTLCLHSDVSSELKEFYQTVSIPIDLQSK